MKQSTAASEYKQLEIERRPYLTRAVSCAALTIPHLVPPENYTPTSPLPSPSQDLGARGVNNLSSKLLISLLPPNSPCFKLIVTDYDIRNTLKGDEDAKTEFEKAFADIERNVTQEIEAEALRVGVNEALRQLVVAGNVCLALPPEGGTRVYSIHNYVVRRDRDGTVRKAIIREKVHKDVLIGRGISPNNHQVASNGSLDTPVSGNASGSSDADNVEVFTCIKLKQGRYLIHQEAWGQIIPGSEGSYPKDRLPYLFLRFYRVDGENWGRSFVEEYYGTLDSYDQLSQVLKEGFAIFSKVVGLVNPTGSTNKNDLAKANNGAILSGRQEDVSFLMSNGKVSDLAAISQYLSQLRDELKYAFLMTSAIQRSGERVTAEEMRIMAQELENSIGGVYVLLSQELQLPLITILMKRMEKNGRLPKLPSQTVRPAIVTGLEALGRGNDLMKLKGFMEDIAAMANIPPKLEAFINQGELIKRAAIGRGIDPNGLVLPQNEAIDALNSQQEMAMVQQALPQAVGALGKVAAQQARQ